MGTGPKRDEPARGDEDTAVLLSELDTQELAVALETEQAGDADVFDFDPDTEYAYRVPSGVVNLEDVTHEDRE